MPPLRERLADELKVSMKAGDKPRLATIRLIQAGLKDRDIEARGAGREPLGDDEIVSLLAKMLKQRQESMAIFDQNGRPELAEAERQEAAIISSFMPQQMGDQEVAAAVDAAIREVGATSMKDMGKVVARLKAEHAGRMDFGRVSGLVKARLTGA